MFEDEGFEGDYSSTILKVNQISILKWILYIMMNAV